MIITEQVLVNSMISQGYACSSQTKNVTPKEVAAPLDFCLCEGRCDFIEYAFSSDDGDLYKNDFTSFLISMIDLSGGFNFFLESENGVKTPLIDNTYGQYFGFGELSQSSKVGFIVDWRKVGTLLGYKKYIFIAEVTEFGIEYEQESHVYKATQFSELLADKTVRFKTINSGCIQNGVDYTGMKWPRSIRMPAKLIEQAPNVEQTESQDSQRRPVQVQLSTRDKWQIETGFIPGSVYSLIKNDLKANDIKVDDYSLYQFRTTKAKPMILSEIEELDTDYDYNSIGRLVFSMLDINLELKRNI